MQRNEVLSKQKEAFERLFWGKASYLLTGVTISTAFGVVLHPLLPLSVLSFSGIGLTVSSLVFSKVERAELDKEIEKNFQSLPKK